MRARNAPGQTWGPAPKATWSRGAGAVEAEGVRVVEEALVAIRGREAVEDAIALPDGHAVDVDLAGARPREELDRGVEAQRLLDRVRDERAVRAERRITTRLLREAVDQVAEQIPGRLVAGDDEEDRLGQGRPAREALSVDLGAQQPRDHVVRRISGREALVDARLEIARELGMELRDRGVDPVGLALPLQHLVGPAREVVDPIVRNAQHLGDHGARDPPREGLHDLGLARPPTGLEGLVEARLRIAPREGLDLGSVVVGEGGVEELADLAVTRLGDRGEQRVLFLRLPDVSEAADEMLDALQTLLDAGLAHEEELAARHDLRGALRAQLREGLVPILGARVEGIDRGGGHGRPQLFFARSFATSDAIAVPSKKRGFESV
jgi:hypothetical protein